MHDGHFFSHLRETAALARQYKCSQRQVVNVRIVSAQLLLMLQTFYLSMVSIAAIVGAVVSRARTFQQGDPDKLEWLSYSIRMLRWDETQEKLYVPVGCAAPVHQQDSAFHVCISTREYICGCIASLASQAEPIEHTLSYEPFTCPVALLSTAAISLYRALVLHPSVSSFEAFERKCIKEAQLDIYMHIRDGASGNSKLTAHMFDPGGEHVGPKTLTVSKTCSAHDQALVEGTTCSVYSPSLIPDMFSSCTATSVRLALLGGQPPPEPRRDLRDYIIFIAILQQNIFHY